MTTISIEEAQAKLPDLIERLSAQESFVIVRDGRVVARIIGASNPEEPPGLPTRRAGSERTGAFWMARDFDDPLDDFREYTE